MSEYKELFKQVSNNLLLVNTSLCKLQAAIERQQRMQSRPVAVSAMVLLFVSGLLVGHVLTEQLARWEDRSHGRVATAEARADR